MVPWGEAGFQYVPEWVTWTASLAICKIMHQQNTQNRQSFLGQILHWNAPGCRYTVCTCMLYLNWLPPVVFSMLYNYIQIICMFFKWFTKIQQAKAWKRCKSSHLLRSNYSLRFYRGDKFETFSANVWKCSLNGSNDSWRYYRDWSVTHWQSLKMCEYVR